jgi:hypothetical protein
MATIAEEEEQDEELTKEDYEHLDETITQMIEYVKAMADLAPCWWYFVP